MEQQGFVALRMREAAIMLQRLAIYIYTSYRTTSAKFFSKFFSYSFREQKNVKVLGFNGKLTNRMELGVKILYTIYTFNYTSSV